MSTFYDNQFDQEFFLIRHPKTIAGHRICYGASDVAVEDTILEQTKNKVLAKLDELDPDECYSSPLIRAKSLAKELFPLHNLILDDRIREVDFGKWEGISWDKISVEDQKKWGDDVLNFKDHGGENFTDLMARVIPFWDDILSTDNKKTVVVAHAGVIVAILSHLLEANPSKVFMLDVDFGSVVRIQVKGGNYFKIKIL